MKKLTKYFLICCFAFIVSLTSWSCSKTNDNLEKSISTETEEENIPTEHEGEETIPSDEEYGKDDGFEKDDNDDQEFEPSGEETSEDPGSEKL